MSSADKKNAPKRLFSKTYLPGYTGHVPSKIDFFGMTEGEVNKAVVFNGGREMPSRPMTSMNVGSTHGIGFYPAPKNARREVIGKNKPSIEIFGNTSRFASNWIGGPTHEQTLQHVPGYKGHIPGLISENVHSKSFAKCTQMTIGKRHPIGS